MLSHAMPMRAECGLFEVLAREGGVEDGGGDAEDDERLVFVLLVERWYSAVAILYVDDTRQWWETASVIGALVRVAEELS